jgi:ATP-dependent DNA helicase RecQ
MSDEPNGDSPPRRRSRRGGRRRGRRRNGRPNEAALAPPPEEPAPKKRVRAKKPAIEYPPASREIEKTAADAARRLGIEALRPEQEQVVADVTSGRDVLLVLPTGFGKSACYQVPSMMLPKPAVVVSPLIALLQDQHTRLLERGVRVVRLDGTVRGKARKAAFAEIVSGGPMLVMTTPETLGGNEAREALGASGVSLVAIDEAHCISEWGYDFRPDYRRLGARIRELGAPPILALTATATELVRDAIVRSLGMRDPAVVAASPHRSNLAFEVLRCEGDVRFRALLRLARRLRRPGIVYCATRAEVDAVYTLLRRFGIPANRYHGGMTGAEREEEQARFMNDGQRAVMVATSAFGLGIDKADIRYVLHFQSPASLEQYVQEAGRGGRDGFKANCILLYDGADRAIHELLLARGRVRPDQLFKLGAALAEWAREGREPNLEALAVSAEIGPRIASALLTKLEEAGLARWEDDQIRLAGSPDTLEDDTRALASQFETLRRQDARRLDSIAEYASSSECRAVYLRRYFGEPDEEPCTLCDICRGSPERPESFFDPLVRPERRNARRGGRRSEQGSNRRGRGGRDRRSRPQRERGPRPAIDPAALAAAAEPFNPLDLEPDAPLGDAPFAAAGGNGRRRRRRGRRGGRRRRGRQPDDGGDAPAPAPSDPID